jgi:hypothetical protein
MCRHATVLQPENPVEHSPITESAGDADAGSNASEQVADEVPVAKQRQGTQQEAHRKSAAAKNRDWVGRAEGARRRVKNAECLSLHYSSSARIRRQSEAEIITDDGLPT